MRKNQCRFYTSPDDLKAQVATSLQHLMKNYPREGWVRAHDVSNARFSEPKVRKKWELPNGEEQLTLSFDVYYKLKNKRYGFIVDGERVPIKLRLSWNEIFYNVGYFFIIKQNAPLPLYNSQSLNFSPQFKSKIITLLEQKDLQSLQIKFDKNMIQRIMLKLMELNCVTLAYDSWKLTATGMKYYSTLKDKFEQ